MGEGYNLFSYAFFIDLLRSEKNTSGDLYLPQAVKSMRR